MAKFPNKEKIGLMVSSPVIGIKIRDVEMLAETSIGRKMLTVLLLVRAGNTYESLPTTLCVDEEEIKDCLSALIGSELLEFGDIMYET